jgi:hypothetical protein
MSFSSSQASCMWKQAPRTAALEPWSPPLYPCFDQVVGNSGGGRNIEVEPVSECTAPPTQVGVLGIGAAVQRAREVWRAHRGVEHEEYGQVVGGGGAGEVQDFQEGYGRKRHREIELG